METGKIINCISNRLRNRSQAVHMELGWKCTGKVLNYILVESTIHPVYQKDLEREFGAYIWITSIGNTGTEKR